MKMMIIMPTYNEKDNIEKMVRILLSLPEKFYVTIVDDNSPDGTGQIADRLADEDPRVHVLHRAGKMGLGTAYIEGFKYAIAQKMDYIFEMDADFSHDPKYLPDMLEAIKEADLVIGSRYYEGVRVDGWRFRRLLLSKFANMYASYVVLVPVWDFTSGFKCFRRKVLEAFDLDRIHSDGYAFQIELTTYAYRKGFKVKEVPILFAERGAGLSKISKNIMWEAFWLVLKLHSPIMEIIKHLQFLVKDYREFTGERVVKNQELPDGHPPEGSS